MKRETTEGKELPNQERIRTFGKKDNNKYLRILEADTIKQAEMKKMGNSKEQGNFLEQCTAAEITSKN